MSVLNGPGEGTWSVFAQKAVAERDELRSEVARLKDAGEVLVRSMVRMTQERDLAHDHVVMLREALKGYYHECQCQRAVMQDVTKMAYAALRATDGPEDKP